MLSVPSKESRACIMATPMAGWVMALSRPAALVVGEDDRGQRGPVDGAVRVDDPGTEAVDQGLIGRTARGHHLAGDLVGVDERGAAGHQQVGHGGLARPDAAGEPDGEHQRGGLPPGPAGDGEQHHGGVVELVGHEEVVGGDAGLPAGVAPGR